MLISCLMPTFNRREFVPNALDYFQRQSLGPGIETELIVLDDGTDPVEDLMPDDPRVFYLRLQPTEKHRTTGEKRNLSCELARGELLMHWDDDDWFSPDRVRLQAEKLMEHPKADLCGISTAYFFDTYTYRAMQWQKAENRRFIEAGRYNTHVMGGSFCYRKTYWESRRFSHKRVGEDVNYLRSPLPKPAVVALAPEVGLAAYVVITHAGNTSPKQDGKRGSRQFNDFLGTRVREIIGADMARYEKLKLPG